MLPNTSDTAEITITTESQPGVPAVRPAAGPSPTQSRRPNSVKPASFDAEAINAADGAGAPW
jgi:hypothetical protein